jgi:hypothetical protein
MFENTRIVKELEATDGIGSIRRLLLGFLIIGGLGAWLFSIGNVLSGFAVILVYGLAGRTRFIGPYLGFELKKWNEERTLD